MTAQLSKKGEAWSARFSEPVSDLVKRYTASVFFDKRLAQVDIQGSLAHARHAGASGHHQQPKTSPTSSAAWRRSAHEIESGAVRMEARPRRRAPEHRNAPDRARRRRRQAPAHRPLAQRPGRHRHPPVAARRDRRASPACCATCSRALLDLAEQHADTIMPGFTHLQVAQPVTLRPPPAGLRGDVRARRRAHAPTAASASTACRWAPPRWPAPAIPIDRERVARDARLRRRLPATRWTPCRDRDFAIEFTRRRRADA